MADQHNLVEKEEQEQYETPQYKRRIMSKYTRPIEFVSQSNDTTINQAQHTKKQKISSSSGDQVASIYHSIISSKPNTTTSPPRNTKGTDLSKEEEWCISCNQKVLKSDYTRHIQGTAHMVSSNNQIPTDLLVLNGSNVGFKMMQSQGWKYEEGLGREGQGRRHPIATVLKQDRLGVGHRERGKMVVTHKYKEIEQRAIARKLAEAQNQNEPGKMIARKARDEMERRAAILRYMKN